MVSAGNSPQVRYSAAYPTGARAYRESDSFAMWAVHHGVTVSMTTVSISSDPLVPKKIQFNTDRVFLSVVSSKALMNSENKGQD